VQRYPDNLFWQRASRALRVARGEEPLAGESDDAELASQ